MNPAVPISHHGEIVPFSSLGNAVNRPRGKLAEHLAKAWQRYKIAQHLHAGLRADLTTHCNSWIGTSLRPKWMALPDQKLEHQVWEWEAGYKLFFVQCCRTSSKSAGKLCRFVRV